MAAQKPGFVLYAQVALTILLILGTIVGSAFYIHWFVGKVIEIRARNKATEEMRIEMGMKNESKPPDRITLLERRVESGLLHTNERIDKLYEIYFDERMRELKERLPPPQEGSQPQR